MIDRLLEVKLNKQVLCNLIGLGACVPATQDALGEIKSEDSSQSAHAERAECYVLVPWAECSSDFSTAVPLHQLAIVERKAEVVTGKLWQWQHRQMVAAIPQC